MAQDPIEYALYRVFIIYNVKFCIFYSFNIGSTQIYSNNISFNLLFIIKYMFSAL